MKNILEKIKTIFKKKNATDRHDIDPHKHWVSILVVFGFFILGLILFSFYVLYEIKNDTFSKDSSVRQEDKVTLKEDLLKQVLDSLYKKSLKEKQIRTEPIKYEDPSL